MEIDEAQDMQIGTCYLCKEENACIPLMSEVGLALELHKKAQSFLNMKLPLDDEGANPLVCTACTVLLIAATDFIRTSRSSQRRARDKLRHFYSRRTLEEVWSTSPSLIPRIKMAPCHFCAERGACIAVFSDFGVTCSISTKAKSLINIGLRISDRDYPTICLACLFKLNSFCEKKGWLRSKHKVPERNKKTYVKPSRKLEKNPSSYSDGTYRDSVEQSRTPSPEPEIAVIEDCDSGPMEDPLALPETELVTLGNETPSPLIPNVGTLTLCGGGDSVLVPKIPDQSLAPRSANILERKTVCKFCRTWLPRAYIAEHERMHLRKPLNVILVDEETPSTSK